MGVPMQGVYAMTKASIISMTKTLATELGTDGIRVNAIAPGLIETQFSQALTQNEVLRDRILERTALKKIGRPEDVAALAAFLASDDADYITGAVMCVDAGWTVS